MNKSTWLVVSCMTGGLALAACGNSSTTGAGGSGSTSTSGSGKSTVSSTTATGSSSSGGAMLVNGCDPTKAVDDTAMTAITIKFGGTVGLKYDQPCIKVKKGTMVTFSGDFITHPLGGGNSPPTVDKASPITETMTGMSATFTLSTAGTFGYFCEVHQSSGMEGAIVVQ